MRPMITPDYRLSSGNDVHADAGPRALIKWIAWYTSTSTNSPYSLPVGQEAIEWIQLIDLLD